MKSLRGLIETAALVVVALAVALGIQAWLVKPYKIPSPSMYPTLKIGQRVLVNRLSGTVHVGDIVVFNPPTGADPDAAKQCAANDPEGTPCSLSTGKRSSQTFIKRTVGVAGDRIAIRNGHVYRNGKRESDSYIAPCAGGAGCNLPHAITIPPGTIYMMGDNRGDSEDSRFWGPLPTKFVIGKAFATYWPPGRIGGL